MEKCDSSVTKDNIQFIDSSFQIQWRTLSLERRSLINWCERRLIDYIFELGDIFNVSYFFWIVLRGWAQADIYFSYLPYLLYLFSSHFVASIARHLLTLKRILYFVFTLMQSAGNVQFACNGGNLIPLALATIFIYLQPDLDSCFFFFFFYVCHSRHFIDEAAINVKVLLAFIRDTTSLHEFIS